MSLKTTLFRSLSRLRCNDGSAAFEIEYFQKQDALNALAGRSHARRERQPLAAVPPYG